MKKTRLISLLFLLMFCLTGAAMAADYAVVDVQKIFTESTPGKAGIEHMKKVQEVLQKAMDEIITLNKGQENTPDGQRAIEGARQVLNRQMAIEQQAVNAALEKELRTVTSDWLKKNTKFMMVVSRQQILGNAAGVDFTSAFLTEMNKRTVTFPDLPKVNINKPEQPAPAAPKEAEKNEKKGFW